MDHAREVDGPVVNYANQIEDDGEMVKKSLEADNVGVILKLRRYLVDHVEGGGGGCAGGGSWGIEKRR